MTFQERMQLACFALMGLGLVLSTVLLWYSKLESGDWAMVCSVLFGSHRVGDAIAGRAR